MYFFQASNTELVFSDDAALDQVNLACRVVGLSTNKVIWLEGLANETNAFQALLKKGESVDPASQVKS